MSSKRAAMDGKGSGGEAVRAERRLIMDDEEEQMHAY